MKSKRVLSVITASVMFFLGIPVSQASAVTVDATEYKYEYEIFPVLKGENGKYFNEYYFIKTDNPDPKSFYFVDENSVYKIEGTNPGLSRCTVQFADLNYEDTDILRVNGGYIFEGKYTDGGQLELMTNKQKSGITCKVPDSVDYIDYLIKTFTSDSNNLFTNLDEVQNGLKTISLYSGSSVRGELNRISDAYWGLQTSPHKDQTFYLVSPYSRSKNKSLFASSVYPYCLDSLGFPGTIAAVARRLEPTVTVAGDSNNHYIVNITYNGTTKSYGGQGNGEGQSILDNQVKNLYRFDNTVTSLSDARKYLVDYSNLNVPNDIPDDDKLTWSHVTDNVGTGSWVRTSGGYYSYLYKKDDRNYFYDGKAGESGSRIYWSGSLGYLSNVWFDGRYINSYENFQSGEKFEDHKDAGVFLYDVPVPQLSYTYKYNYNYTTQKNECVYDNIQVTYVRKNITLYYNNTGDYWTTTLENSNLWEKFISEGRVSEKYLDAVRFTAEELKQMGVDANTDKIPDYGQNYDRTVVPGTPFGELNKTVYSENGFIKSRKEGGTQIIKISAVTPEMIECFRDDRDILSCYINAVVSDSLSECFELDRTQFEAISCILE